MKSRHRSILFTLWELGRFATTRQIAQAVKLHVNGVSQSLKKLQTYGYVRHLDGKAGDMRWQLLQLAVDELKKVLKVK